MSIRSLRYNTIEQHFTKSALASTDRDALAFLEAAQIYNTNQQRAIVNLVRSLKRTGLWSKMKAIYPFIGGTATSHKWNLKDPRDVDAAFRLQFFGGITHSANGVDPNGSSGYANTFITPATHLTQNSTHLAYYSRENSLRNDQEFGVIKVNSALILILRWFDTGLAYSFAYDTSNGVATGANSDSRGLHIATRTANNVNKVFRNATQLGNTATGTASGWTGLDVSLYLLARNNNNTTDQYGTRQCAFASVGDGLTDADVTNFYNIVDLYQKRLGRAV